MGSCETNGLDEPNLNSTDINVLKTDPDVKYCGELDGDQNLYAGNTQTIAGTATTYNTSTHLYITVDAPAGYQQFDKDGNPMDEQIKIWVGTDLGNLPTAGKGCAPVNGKFPYKLTMNSDETTGTINIPLEDINDYDESTCDDEPIYVVVHVDILTTIGDPTSGETAYAGDPAECNRWWNYYSYIPKCCGETPPPVEERCETAFAAYNGDFPDATCFLNIDENNDNIADFNRWGWTYGPIIDPTTVENGNKNTSIPIYAGAAECSFEKGTLVGSLVIHYDGEIATVTYIMLDGYYMTETQLYVGNEILPSDVNDDYTVAPGQYGNIHDDLEDATSDSYTIKGLSGDIYVVAHAEVCWLKSETVD